MFEMEVLYAGTNGLVRLFQKISGKGTQRLVDKNHVGRKGGEKSIWFGDRRRQFVVFDDTPEQHHPITEG